MVAIKLETMHKYLLTPNELVILNVLYLSKKLEFTRLINKFGLDYELSKLILEKYIEIRNEEYIITPKTVELFEEKEDLDKWLEFKELYPKKDGSRMLGGGTIDKRKYINYCNLSPDNHAIAIRGLTNHLKASKEPDYFGGWQNMSTYINNQSWEKYLDYSKTETVDRFSSL